MTLPVSPNSISVSQINTEMGAAITTSRTLQYLNGLIKSAQRPATPNMDSFRGKAYFQMNTQGNCNNGNEVNCDCNCGDIECGAFACSPINCVNCDTQAWFQTNCNCACTYNCDLVNCYSYNCNCQCSG